MQELVAKGLRRGWQGPKNSLRSSIGQQADGRKMDGQSVSRETVQGMQSLVDLMLL